MQQKSDSLMKFQDRFERLKKHLGVSTSSLCKTIGISRSQFYAIKAGEQELSEKMNKRLAEKETDSGIMPPAGESKLLLEFLLKNASIPELLRRLEEIKADTELNDLKKWQLASYVIEKLSERIDAEEKAKR